MPIRPEGYNYDEPDPEDARCRVCNPQGMNRTGIIPIALVGTSSTVAMGMRCPAGCDHGLNRPVYGKM